MAPDTTRLRAAFESLMADVKALMDHADFVEASGLVVVIFDPETGKRAIHGPFSKVPGEAEGWASEDMRAWNEANKSDGPDLIYTVELLFAPTER